MNPTDYAELTLDAMEFDLVSRRSVGWSTTDEVIESMYGIPSLPEAVELSVMEFNYGTF